MGNVFHRYIGCADIEIIGNPRECGSRLDDNIKLMDHLEFVELDLSTSEIEIELE